VIWFGGFRGAAHQNSRATADAIRRTPAQRFLAAGSPLRKYAQLTTPTPILAGSAIGFCRLADPEKPGLVWSGLVWETLFRKIIFFPICLQLPRYCHKTIAMLG